MVSLDWFHVMIGSGRRVGCKGGCLLTWFADRILSDEADPDALALWNDRKFRMFVYAVTGAYSGILIRCIYR